MLEDSDPRRELWGLAGEEEEDTARLPSDDSAESGCDEPRAQWGGGCKSPAPHPLMQWSLWARKRHCPPLAPRPFLGDRQAQGDAGAVGRRRCYPTEPVLGRPDGFLAGLLPWGGSDSSPCRTPGLPHSEEEPCGAQKPALKAISGPSRTLSHPSFQDLFTAAATSHAPSCLPGVGAQASSSESGASVGHPPLVDCSSFYYTDPTLPPGLRVYNWLSCASQAVCRGRPLNTPAPIMAVREAPPPSSQTVCWQPVAFGPGAPGQHRRNSCACPSPALPGAAAGPE